MKIDIYYTSNNKSKESDTGCLTSTPLLNVPNYAVTDNNSGMGCFYKKLKGKFVAHRDDGPAILDDTSIWFFYDGINYTIEDMPIDNETKLMLVLKYTQLTDYQHTYATYEPLPNFNVYSPLNA